MKLIDRTILVTGGSSGIGLAMAEAFLEAGNTVIITGRNQAKLDAAKARHPALTTLVCDASDPSAVAELGRRLRADFPKLDVLFNNAGLFEFHNLRTGSDDLEGLTRQLDTNLAGPMRTVSALVDQLTDNRGTIINVSSGLAFVPIQAAPIYCATKAGLHSYTVTLRQQLQGRVEVVELMPPAVATDMTTDFKDSKSFKLMPLTDLVAGAMAGLRSGSSEIRPGQSNQLHWMSRVAPGFIQGQLAKGSAEFVPTDV